ncbi:F-box domain-containing protein [Favolaschia claudopus]|uniref:F-box domain-containing protein n=1 Tax=Favolaschia claudopus TaxID=2862362 RepID=A0AAV9ZNF9_9AGAR
MAAPQQRTYCKLIAEVNQTTASSTIYHLAFADPDAEIALESAEGTLYRVHSYTLQTTSGLFKTLLSLPPPPGGHSTDPIPVYQPDAVLEPLLRLMCGLETPPWTSIDALSAVLFLAQNWDAPGPLASLRSALTSHKFLTSDPLRVYALASHFGFRPETQLASTRTLSSNIFSLESFDILSTMPASATLPLLRLHRARRDALRTLFDSPERFLAGNGQPFHCSSCAITPLENSSWRALKHRVLRELDVCSSGAAMQDYGIAAMQDYGIAVSTGGMWGEDGMGNWPEAKACWAAVCVKPGCGATNYDRVATIRQMRACLDGLPFAVDVDWLDEDRT